MKNVLKISIIFLCLIAFGSVSAQKAYKFGHIDSQALLQLLPDTKTAKTALEAEQKKVEIHLQTMQAELQSKYQVYTENENLVATSPEKWTALIKQEKESEMQSLQQRLQDFQGSAEKSLQTKQTELYKPILDKVDNAIQEVAKEGKFTYIFDVNVVLYFSEEMSVDITRLVKKKLGVE